MLFDIPHTMGLLDAMGIREGAQFLLEDACKLVGISGWLHYFAGTALVAVLPDPAEVSVIHVYKDAVSQAQA